MIYKKNEPTHINLRELIVKLDSYFLSIIPNKKKQDINHIHYRY